MTQGPRRGTTTTTRGATGVLKMAALGGVLLLLASCGGDDQSAAPTGNGQTEPLQLGSLLAATGDQASAVEPLIAATQLAINDINAAGGVFGKDVNYKHQDSTSDNDTALTASDALINWGSDIIIGTYGSAMASAVVEPITEAGVLMVSGSNTSSELTGVSELYFRTAPTDALEAASITDLLIADGKTSVGIIWQNDAWGGAFERALVENLNAGGVEIVANQPYNVEDTDYTSQVNSVLAAEPDAVVFLSYATYTGPMIEQLVGTNGYPSENVYFSSSTLGDYSEGVSDQRYLEGIQAFQPGADPVNQEKFEARVKKINPDLTTFAYAASTYDATIIAALGAIRADSADGAEIAKHMREISGSSGDGEKCTTFAACKQLLEDGKTIDYDGLTGGIAFDENNDETETNYISYVYNADGTYSLKEE